MRLLRLSLFSILLSIGEQTIHLYHTEDGQSMEYYDCLYLGTYLYCRRPTEPVLLARNRSIEQSCHNGTRHSFHSMKSNNITASMVVYTWRSTLEMADRYARYLRDSTQFENTSDLYLCQCHHQRSFGKTCEYLLPIGARFSETANWQTTLRKSNLWSMQVHGDILCYKTLECNCGLLCLDWRNICDGFQQCMFGTDEENCDLLQFNECEPDEYRCMNGMCIPDQYFVNGQYECMDLTDETGFFIDGNCPTQQASLECDERLCFPRRWSCGDGQCIEHRLAFQDKNAVTAECRSRREQYHMCEMHHKDKLWTLPDGRCQREKENYDEVFSSNYTSMDKCLYYLKCMLSERVEINCSCVENDSCFDEPGDACPTTAVQYPGGAMLAPYLFFYYETTRNRARELPDFIVLNGSIKCRGYMVHFHSEHPYSSNITLTQLESFLCNYPATHHSRRTEGAGYDTFGYNASKTFTNRSYRVADVCRLSRECLSSYQVLDGFHNCADRRDEAVPELVAQTCAGLERHRFRCSEKEPSCFTVNNLGDTFPDCDNKFDESWMGFGSTISKLSCAGKLKEDCPSIRGYVQDSWLMNTDSSFQGNSLRRIQFRAYCDTFWDYYSKADEDRETCQAWWVCLDNQWQCRTGQCIDDSWVLDGEWDCSDASDEESIFPLDGQLWERNRKIFDQSYIERRFEELYANQPLSTLCRPKEEFPCYGVNSSDPLSGLASNRPCISLERVGDNHVDCLGGIDEQNTIDYCRRVTMLGKNFKCLTSQTCHSYASLCDQRCPHRADDEAVCYGRERSPDCADPEQDFMCYNGTCAKSGWCDKVFDCLYGEDEYLCVYPEDVPLGQSASYHRRDKEYGIVYEHQLFQLPQFPAGISTSPTNETPTNSSTVDEGSLNALKASAVPYLCNRGIGLTSSNGSFVCFCPQSYYGEKCQFYSDRLTLIFQMNFSQSISASSSNLNVLFKMIVLFLFNNQTVDSYEFHDRPTLSNGLSSKKIDHFVYPRAEEYLRFRQQRYFDRQQILHEHPYAVRIEAYRIEPKTRPELIAVWQYQIYFDFLPAFRLVKILQLVSFQHEPPDPCARRPCHARQQCQRLMNEPAKHVCLCSANFQGENCSQINTACSQGFCSPNALCKPGYRGVLQRNDLPYCICPNGMYGSTCHLSHVQCQSHPCQHNGTCLPTSTPGGFICHCQPLYHGNTCELEKELVQLHIQQSVEHRGAVLQYFDVDLAELNLVLLYQYAVHQMPKKFTHLNAAKGFAELAVVKLYTDVLLGIYLIALHINVPSINGSTVINEQTRCVPIQVLFNETEEISPMKYHQLCRRNHSLLCFHDERYLCICETNHSRVDCFGYDHSLDRCSRCLAGGRCLQGERARADDYICICPLCYSGEFCQFSSISFSFTLDQLFAADLLSENRLSRHVTFYSLIFGSWLIFLFGLINNTCCFVTLRRPKCQTNGVGQYLLAISIFNQISLGFLACRLTHLAVNITSYRGNPWMDTVLCSMFSYLGLASSQISYWLVALIAIERACTTVFLNRYW